MLFKLIYFWRIIKFVPFLRKIISSIYYFINGFRKNITGKNNIVFIDLSQQFPFIKNCSFEIEGSENNVIIKPGVRLTDIKISIKGDRHQLILENNCIITGGCLWMRDYECKLSIGKNTTIAEASIGVGEPKSSVVLGEDCMLSHDIDIRCTDSHAIINLDSNKRINYAQDIHIANHVWIAKSVQILKGVKIGSNSIIGAGSIVTKDIPENCIAVGIPAEVNKSGVTWTR